MLYHHQQSEREALVDISGPMSMVGTTFRFSGVLGLASDYILVVENQECGPRIKEISLKLLSP